MKKLDTHTKEHLTPEFVKKNPQHTVPFYEENGFCLSESRAIVQYLVDSRAPESGLLGRFPKRRALIAQRGQFELGTIGPRINAAFTPLVYGTETTVSEEKMQSVKDAIAIVDTYLSKSTYIAGDGITIADFSYLAFFAIFTVN